MAEVDAGTTTQGLLLSEARWARELYRLLATALRIEFTRKEGEGLSATRGDVANSLLDHGNYIAYGYAAVVLCGLGISFALPLLHGKTRRGALVFDVADLIKDAHVMPLAFLAARGTGREREFRDSLIERCQEQGVLDHLFGFIEELAKNS